MCSQLAAVGTIIHSFGSPGVPVGVPMAPWFWSWFWSWLPACADELLRCGHIYTGAVSLTPTLSVSMIDDHHDGTFRILIITSCHLSS